MNATRQPDAESAASFRQYLDLLRRRWLAIVLVTGVVLGGVLAYTFLAAPTYESQAELLVRSLDTGSPGGGSDNANLETERQLLLSTAVASRAVEGMKSSRTPTDLLAHATVTIPASTQVLVVKFKADSPVEAQRGAQAFADAYLAYRRDKALEAVASVGSVVEQRIGALQAQLNKARATLADPNASATDKQEASAGRDSLIGQIGILQAQLATISTSGVSPGEVIEPANLPGRPSSPNAALNLPGGLFLGLILAGMLAIARDRLVESLGGRHGFEQLLGRPVLGVIPNDLAWKRPTEARLVTLEDPDGRVAEAYRTLATKLVVLAKRHDIKTVAVVSASPGEGKSSVAANLSIALVEEGRWVLLVSADTRRPRIHQFFGLSDEVGLLNVLADEVPTDEVLQAVHPWHSREAVELKPRLQVMPSGHAIMQSVRGLGSDAIDEFLKLQRDRFDFVLIDSPPALLVADALAIATAADGVLVVADGRSSKPHAIGRLLEQLEHVGAHVLGGVLSRYEPPGGTGRQRYYGKVG